MPVSQQSMEACDSISFGQTDNEGHVKLPARGREMRNVLLQKLRAPPLVHVWEFWHDKSSGNQRTTDASATDTLSTFKDDKLISPRQTPLNEGAHAATVHTTSSSLQQKSPNQPTRELALLNTIRDIRAFWQTFNNFDVTQLSVNDAVHLFHQGVEPVVKHERNRRGGAWTFRIISANASAFWTELGMMAVGEMLQQAVESNRPSFRDDICGISLRALPMEYAVSVWNRDANHTPGVQRLHSTILSLLSPDLTPLPRNVTYKKHYDTEFSTNDNEVCEPVALKHPSQTSPESL